MTTTDAHIANMLGIPLPKARTSADEPPPGFYDEPELSDAAEPTQTNGAPATPKKSGRERQAEHDRSRIVWGDALEFDPGPTKFICEGFAIAPGRPSVIVGEGGSKKSFLAQYFQICVATGHRFLGRYDVQRGAALFMDFEAGLPLARRRLQRFGRGMDFSLAEHKDRLAYIERPFFFDDVDRAAVRLADLVRGFTVVIVDSAFRSAPKLRQNDAEAAIPFEIMTRASLETGCSFIVVDHASTKREEGARRKSMQSGNHHKLDGAGTVYALSGEKGKPVLVTCEREQLEGEYVPDFAFDVIDVLDPACELIPGPHSREERKWGLRIQEFGAEAAKPQPKKPTTDDGPALYQVAQRVLEEVKKKPGVSSGELLETLGIRKQRFLAALGVLRREEKVTNRTGKETRTEWVAS